MATIKMVTGFLFSFLTVFKSIMTLINSLIKFRKELIEGPIVASTMNIKVCHGRSENLKKRSTSAGCFGLIQLDHNWTSNHPEIKIELQSVDVVNPPTVKIFGYEGTFLYEGEKVGRVFVYDHGHLIKTWSLLIKDGNVVVMLFEEI